MELSKKVSGDVTISENKVVLDNLQGITADIIGPFNADLDAITITPGNVNIDL